jgi:alkylation response protein AidB-like acyl-CoA dehydrogenase
MNFDLTEEQLLLQASVARFVDERYGLDKRKTYLATADGFSRENWSLLAELGVLALNLPEHYGGLALGAVESMLVMEQFGRGLVVEPYVSTVVMGARVLLHAGGRSATALLPQVASGELQLALAVAEPQGRYALNHVGTIAKPTSGGFVLNGRKTAVLHGASADTLIVSARVSGSIRDFGGVALFAVPRETAGLEIKTYRLADGQPAAEVTFRDAHVPADTMFADEGSGYAIVETVAAETALALCCEAVGAMQALFDITVEYAKTRQQFGVPIGSFQALQHRLADAYTKLELARSLVYRGMLFPNAGRQAWMHSVAGIKAFVGEVALAIGHEAIQLHGGMGMTDELIVSHYHKRLFVIHSWFGDPATHWARHADLARAS